MFPFASIVPISAERGTQLAELRAEIVARLPESPPLYPEDDLTDRDERFLAAEFIREKIFRLLGDEIPYATTVGVEQFTVDGALAAHSRDGLRRQGEPARDPAGRGRLADEGDRHRRRGTTWSACSAARSSSRCSCA